MGARANPGHQHFGGASGAVADGLTCAVPQLIDLLQKR
jgi:hypothetical protein